MYALAWGIAAALGILAAISFAMLVVPDFGRRTEWHAGTALIAGIAVTAVLLWRVRQLVSFGRVALWIEERVPALQYSLVTAIEGDYPGFSGSLESTVEKQDIGQVTFAALRRTLLPALTAVGIGALLLHVSPSAVFGGGGLFHGLGDTRAGAVALAGSRLDKLGVRVTPPAYTGERPKDLDDPSSVTALPGSRILVNGDGASTGITGSIGNSPITVAGSEAGWSASLVMPAMPAALTFRDRSYDRIIVLDPRTDNPPKIVLTSPVRDTTLRVAQLVVHLNATATDDIGLGAGYFEYLITTGSGEVFNARTLSTPIVRFGGSRSGSMTATLNLASLKLGEGDVVSIRAIAEDGNTLSGAGLATSDTRTIRIARASEYDSLAVDAAAPLPIDSSAMSQRMLIAMTEKLVREQTAITRQELVKRSTEIGDLEDRIRKRVHEILFETEDRFGKEQPGEPLPSIEEMEPADDVTEAKNPDLSDAFSALWQAVRSLQIAEPGPALPPMRVALRALDRARLANRLYLRGTPPKVIVDLSRVRMTGKEKGSGSTRAPRPATDSAQLQLERRLSDAIELIPRQPASAIRAFTLLQVDALSVSPSFAAALSETIDAFRKGRDATLPLLRARRALSGNTSGVPGLPSWSGGW